MAAGNSSENRDEPVPPPPGRELRGAGEPPHADGARLHAERGPGQRPDRPGHLVRGARQAGHHVTAARTRSDCRGPGGLRGVRGRGDAVRGRVHREHGGREPRERGHRGDRPDRRLVGDGARGRGLDGRAARASRSGRRASTTAGWRDESQVGAQSPYLSAQRGQPATWWASRAAPTTRSRWGATRGTTPATRYRTSLDGRQRDRRAWTRPRSTGDISDFSSPGKTRDGRIKPELTAPGERVLGAVSKDAYPGPGAELDLSLPPLRRGGRAGRERHGGPRFRAAAGDVVLGAGGERGSRRGSCSTNPTLDAIQVRNMLVNSAVADGFTGAVPNERWGYGKVDEAVGGAPLPSDLRITVDALPGGVRTSRTTSSSPPSGGRLPYTWSRSRVRCPREWSWRARGCSPARRRAAAPSRSRCR